MEAKAVKDASSLLHFSGHSELETGLFSVGADRPVKEDHLWKWTTLTGKFLPGPNRSIYYWTEISGNFSIMEITPGKFNRF